MSPIGDLARQDEYDLPDVGPPLIPSGPQFSPGVPAVNQMMGSLLTPRPRDPQSPIAYRTASPLVNIREQDIADATEAAQAFSGGGLGIKAYHGSPHDFEKFDLSKIGSGEGAQAYGHGLYFAENPEVARSYKAAGQPSYLGADRISAAQDILKEAGGDRRTALDLAQAKILGTTKYSEGKLWTDVLNNFNELVGKTPGRMYEVDIKADPAHFLDLNKSLSEQSKIVQDVLPQVSKPFEYHIIPSSSGHTWIVQHPGGWTPNAAQNYYRSEAAAKAAADSLNQQRIVSDMVPRTAAQTSVFNEAGIPGIKYLDQGSRTKGVGSSNYVVFNPGIIDILRKYGIAGAAPLGMGALAAQDQYNQP